MSKSRNRAVLLQAVGFLLVLFLARPALAAPVKLPSGEKAEISSEQTTTIIFPIPISLVEGLSSLVGKAADKTEK